MTWNLLGKPFQPLSGIIWNLVSARICYLVLSSGIWYLGISLLAGTSVSNLTHLQLVQNTLAWVVTQKPWFCYITLVLSDLHWLPVCHRISFKIATVTFRVLQFQQPSYLASLIPRYVLTRALCSSSSLSICVSHHHGSLQIIFICCFG